ncbi:MAG TPA: sialidase family protein [Anaerolineales bacterium]|nr:sialidase family protein [Anaerolineales bacterium]
MEVNDDDEVVLIYRRADSHSATNSILHIRFSDDYGATWSDEDKDLLGNSITNFPFDPAGYSATEHPADLWLYKAPNGDLILHTWRTESPAEADNCTYQSISTDGGKTWSAGADITLSGHSISMVFATDDYFVYDGVIYAAARDFSNTEADSKMIFIKSTDNGATWTYVSEMRSGATDEPANEVGIEYLGNNRIIAIYRTVAFTATARSYSDDMGLTWSKLEAITYNIPVSGRHRIWTKTHFEGGANWWNDTNLVMCGFVNFPGTGRKIAVWYSKDAGETWSPPRYLEGTIYNDAGYADMVYNSSNGQYVLVSYIGPYETAIAALKQYNITPDWNADEA